MENLLIVFCKNPELGKVKNRLAKSIGKKNALTVYQALLQKTAQVLEQTNFDIHVYYSELIAEEDVFNSIAKEKKVQIGKDLGERMGHAFQSSLQAYKKAVIIGTDLWTLKAQDIEDAFKALEKHTAVLGPSFDGGYYLLGLTHFIPNLFQNKIWGTDEVFEKTQNDLKNETLFLLSKKNDIDTIEDLQLHPDLALCIN